MEKNHNRNNQFVGCMIVATGKLENLTRDGINSKITSLGATAGSSVTRKTNYLICGEQAVEGKGTGDICPYGTGVP